MHTYPIDLMWSPTGPQFYPAEDTTWLTKRYGKPSIYIGSGKGIGQDGVTYKYDVFVILQRSRSLSWVPEYCVNFGGTTGAWTHEIVGYNPTGIDKFPLSHTRETLEHSWWQLVTQVEDFR